MKKIFSIILVLTLILSLCSCGNDAVNSTSESYSGAASIVNSAIEIVESVQDLNSSTDDSVEPAPVVTTPEVTNEWVTKDMEIPELPEIQYTSVPILDGYEQLIGTTIFADYDINNIHANLLQDGIISNAFDFTVGNSTGLDEIKEYSDVEGVYYSGKSSSCIKGTFKGDDIPSLYIWLTTDHTSFDKTSSIKVTLNSVKKTGATQELLHRILKATLTKDDLTEYMLYANRSDGRDDLYSAWETLSEKDNKFQYKFEREEIDLKGDLCNLTYSIYAQPTDGPVLETYHTPMSFDYDKFVYKLEEATNSNITYFELDNYKSAWSGLFSEFDLGMSLGSNYESSIPSEYSTSITFNDNTVTEDLSISIEACRDGVYEGFVGKPKLIVDSSISYDKNDPTKVTKIFSDVSMDHMWVLWDKEDAAKGLSTEEKFSEIIKQINLVFPDLSVDAMKEAVFSKEEIGYTIYKQPFTILGIELEAVVHIHEDEWSVQLHYFG